MARFMALYIGSADSATQEQWAALGPDRQAERSQRAMQAWGEWVERNRDAIVDIGAPLGKTLLADLNGVSPTTNLVTAYVIVEAADHETAAEMFRDHPHFAIFPGSGVEIMPCMPMPGM